MPLFQLTLSKTYYQQGFFNVPVAHDGHVRSTDGPIKLALGASGVTIDGQVNRRANRNRTARIMGGATLRDWFQANYSQGDVVEVTLGSSISIRSPASDIGVAPTGINSRPQAATGAVGDEELANCRRRLVRLVNALYEGPQRDSVAAKIGYLSHSQRIPRELAALMRVVTEMRNVSEYSAKRLSQNESVAVRAAWAAILEWASSTGLKV